MVQEVEGVGIKDDIAGTLDSNYYKGQGVRGGIERTAVCMGNGQLNQAMGEKTGALNCMHDQQAIMTNKTVRRLTPIDFNNYLLEMKEDGATKGIKALLVLWKNYGAEKVFEWCSAILERIQQAEVLQQGVHEKSILPEATQGNKLDDSPLPCPKYIADWLLRDLWEQQECRCSPQRWERAEQFARELNESVQKLSQQNTSSEEDVHNMWEPAEGIRLLRETLSEVQKIWRSFIDKNKWANKTVRRLTPLEAERLQGFEDDWTNTGMPDRMRYFCMGNALVVPMITRMGKILDKIISVE
jgi:hypothetical protein